MPDEISSKRVVTTSFLVDVSDVVLNVLVAIFTGSIVMLTQALQGVSDLVASGLLVVGVKRSERPADRAHPFGYGKELYFWTLLAGLVMFTITAGLSFYLGWQRFINPKPIENIIFAYVVLLIGITTNTYAFSLSFRRLLGKKDPARIWSIFRGSALVATKATLILDLMGALAGFFGLVALLVFGITGDLRFDGLGAIVIGVVLAILALFLLLGVKDLVVGRSAPMAIEERIRKAALATKGVQEVLDLRTMLIGAGRILVNLEVHIQDELTTREIERLVDEIKKQIKVEVKRVHHIPVELETPDSEIKKRVEKDQKSEK